MDRRLTEEGQTIALADGRRLGYLEVGEGKPVLYFHGIPTSRLDVLFLKEIAHSRHLRIIGIDRPGFGLSTFSRRKSLRDFAADINFLVDFLHIEQFALLGWSAGGPHVITYAALFPERVTCAIVVGSVSLPFEMRTIEKLEAKIPFIGILAGRKIVKRDTKAAEDPSSYLESEEWKKRLEFTPKEDANFFRTNHSRWDSFERVRKPFAKDTIALGRSFRR
jgi:pimeloyl-ACP methyl ester carboxylesterase